jgi:hypothetical protein
MTEKPEILLYQTEDGQTKVEVRLENETVAYSGADGKNYQIKY